MASRHADHGSTRALLLTVVLLAAVLVFGLLSWAKRDDLSADPSPAPPLAAVSASQPGGRAVDAPESAPMRLSLPAESPRSSEDLALAQRVADSSLPGLLAVRVLLPDGRAMEGTRVMLFPDGPVVTGEHP